MYLPHLTLNKSQLLNNSVSHTSKGDRVWATGIVVGAVDVVIPHLAIAIKSPVPVSIPGNPLSTEQPGTALVLVAHREGVVEPVLDVLVPQEGALVVDIDVAKTSRVHDRLDRVGLVQEHDLAPARGIIMPAVLKGRNDRRRRVGAIGPRLDNANVAGGSGRGLREDEGQLERRRGKGLAHCEGHDKEEGLAATERSHLALCLRASRPRLLYRGES